MKPAEAKALSARNNTDTVSLQKALMRVRFAAEDGHNQTDLSYANTKEVRKQLRAMGYTVRWSFLFMDHIVSW